MAFFRSKFAKINNDLKSCCIFQFSWTNNTEYLCGKFTVRMTIFSFYNKNARNEQ